MSKTIDYYLSPVSPWTYLGHQRFTDLAAAYGAAVVAKPVDYGPVFKVSGGLPLKQRPLQRQAYRMMELKRWRACLDLPLTLEPRYFPTNANPAALLITAALPLGTADTMRLAGALMRACWAEDKDISDPGTLQEIADGQGLAGAELLASSRGPEALATYEKFTGEAIEAQVFGAPTYVYRGELFWGQDRLDLLERALKA